MTISLAVGFFIIFPSINANPNTLTYYFDNYDVDEVWVQYPERLCDGDLETWAIALGVSLDTQLLTSNTCDGSNLGVIRKVEIRSYSDTSSGSETTLRPVFTGGDGDNHVYVHITANFEWSDWYDITNDTNTPSTWTFTHVQNLDCDIENSNPPNFLACAKVEIRVTLEPINTYVDDDAIPSWYDSTHVKTIQEGIDNTTDDSTVYIHNGIYSESDILVNKAVTIIGEHRNNVIVNDLLATSNVFYVTSDNVKISNLTIYAINEPSKCGCLFKYSNFSTISNCDITSIRRGIYVQYSEGVKIENCVINDTQMDGIRFRYDSPYGRIYNSTINTHNNSSQGIRLTDNSPNAIIDNCSIYGSMIFDYSGFQTVTNCNIFFNGSVVINIRDSSYLNFTDVNIYGGITGFDISGSDNTTMSNCNLYNIKYGFWLYNSANSIHVKDCSLTGLNTSVGYGIMLYYEGGSPNDCIFKNMSISSYMSGFYLYGYSENTIVNNLTVYDCDTAFSVQYGSNNHFSNLTIYNCSGDGFGIYKSVNNNTLRDSTIDDVEWGLYEGWGDSAPEYTTFENVTVTNSTYGLTFDSAYHDNSVYQYCTIKDNDYGVYVSDYYAESIGNITWDETNIVFNNNLDYYIQNNASINIFSNYLFDSNIKNDISDSKPYVNYHHIIGDGLKEFNTAKMITYCSSGESAKITILDNNLTRWSVNQSSGTIYQKLGGFRVGIEYEIKFDDTFLHYDTATFDTILKTSTGIVYANYSGDWSSHIFTIDILEVVFPPISVTSPFKYVGFALIVLICIAVGMYTLTSKKRIRLKK